MPHSNTAKSPTGPAPMIATSQFWVSAEDAGTEPRVMNGFVAAPFSTGVGRGQLPRADAASD
jgi:hypothetical protein